MNKDEASVKSSLNKKTIRELVSFEYHILYLNLLGSKIDKNLYTWSKTALVTSCDETIWRGLVEPIKEHLWSQISELLK